MAEVLSAVPKVPPTPYIRLLLLLNMLLAARVSFESVSGVSRTPGCEAALDQRAPLLPLRFLACLNCFLGPPHQLSKLLVPHI